jgi:siroheme synthase-like protein
MAFDYPVVLDVSGASVLVVGGGRVALRKIEALLRAGASVHVVAPDVIEAIRELPVVVRNREYVAGDLDGVRLAFTATDEPEVNAAVAADAAQRGIWVNAADDPGHCTFTLPAVTRDGPVTIAISTGGSSPALAAYLRDEIQRWLGELEVAAAAHDLEAQRADLHAQGLSTESIDWSQRVRDALRHQ